MTARRTASERKFYQAVRKWYRACRLLSEYLDAAQDDPTETLWLGGMDRRVEEIGVLINRWRRAHLAGPHARPEGGR
jgi:hypothetical protein